MKPRAKGQRVAGSKNYLIERVVKGLGRFRISSGTDSRDEFKRRNAIVVKLVQDYGSEGLDALRLLKDGLITWRDLLDADRLGTLREASQQILIYQPLHTSFEGWVAVHTARRRGKALAENTRDRYRCSWKHFTKLATEMKLLKDGATIADLRRVDWAKLRANWGASGHDWNDFRIALSAFLNNAFNRGMTKFRDELMKVLPSPERYAKRKKAPLSVMEFFKVAAHTPEHYQIAYVAMLMLAAGPDAYTRMTRKDLDAARHIVRIPDPKNEDRDREVEVPDFLWPWIDAAVPAPAGDQALRRQWNKAVKAVGIDRRVIMYSLRSLSMMLQSQGGAPLEEISMYVGHDDVRTTMRHYLAGMVARKPGLALAAELLKAGLPSQPTRLLPPPATSVPSASPSSPDSGGSA